MSKERKTPVVLGLDMGGTHTDAVLLRGGTLLASVKVPTNHQDLLVSTREALHALFESGAAFPADVSRATFGTTLAVNAVVQDACAPVGLLIGAGPGLDPGWFGLGSHTALVPGGVDHRGREIVPPDREAIRRVVGQWRKEGLAAFACVAKFSTRNPAHEDAMAEVIREVFADGPEPVIALGHRLSGRLNFPRRIATAYWNAAVWTLHNRFADAVEASLKDMGIDAPAYLLKADGGAIPLSVSRERPVEALLSGPAFARRDFEACTRLHRELTGQAPVYFRPPWGISTPVTNRCVRHYHMKRILWDVMAQDWEKPTTSAMIAQRLKDRVFDGAVLCLHDAGEDTGGAKGAPMRTIDALISVIPWLKSRGYEFLTLDQYIKGVTAHDIPQRKKNILWP